MSRGARGPTPQLTPRTDYFVAGFNTSIAKMPSASWRLASN